MITKDNFETVLKLLNFEQHDEVYIKKFNHLDCELRADFKNKKLIYPEDKGLIVNDKTTSNFSSPENFVVFECIHKLFSQGYHPKHIELEKKWSLGHSQKSGKADVYIKDNNDDALLIIECKTAGNEYKKAIDILENDSKNQLFSYLQQAPETKFLALYASDFIDNSVSSNYYLINVTDNNDLLENNKKLKSYKEASQSENKHKVWCETYDREYATVGIFENNKPYEIGKTKFTKDDLHDINSKDIQGKYHEFATILRQHNVSGRENAFDKLVNLFLCKVTDEKENPDELKFYYKGKAYDNPFDFQDRLQQLYKIGMDKFLGDEITYIANDKIDEAFDTFKNKPNATKDMIKKFVRELKFFTNNDFAFIDVHNEKLFYQNFEVLLKVSKMIQDIKLTGSEENQFLGDMFESFLDQGVKQSEGQFFTPMPLVKFIINSLPDKQNPKVIDYACGAGHFLNEYASLNQGSKIVGVEKEYRLSKVAKVSSFMYGSDMEIIYSDALAKNDKLKNESFDILIANPPYSVKGFLQTLSDEDKQNYELIDAVDSKSYSKTGAIECFFIERAKQLLKKDAVVGIIVPSSILNKDTPKLYTKTREIILKHFDIVAIAEFGSGTFGKTGTNTVTLFLRKRGNNPDLSIHYLNMVNSWFECDFESNEAFKDSDILKQYCSHIEVDFEIYKTILCDNLDNTLFENETFKEYQTEFEKLTSTKERKKKKYYQNLSKEEEEELERKELIKFIKEIEKDKLYYFALASIQDNDVVIVKSPTKNNDSKKFLGYEWGGRKGSEGIKYLSSVNIEIEEDFEEDDLDSEDKRVLENLEGLKYINTPLYNPQDIEDNSKINKIIKDNFSDIKTFIPEELKEFVSRSKLVNMLDFNRVDFNKAIGLTPVKKLEIESKYDIDKLIKYIDINIETFDPTTKPNNDFIYVDIDSVGKGNGKVNYTNIIKGREAPSRARRIVKNDSVVISTVRPYLKGFTYIKEETKNCIFSTGFAILQGKNGILSKYIFELFMNSDFLQKQIDAAMPKAAYPSINKTDIENFKIPIPPLDIQKKILKECQIVDDEILKADTTIEQLNQEIKNDFKSLYAKADKPFRLSDNDNFDTFIGKRVLAKDIVESPADEAITVYSANVFEPFGYIKKQFIKDFSQDSILWGIDGDWMVNYMPKDTPFYPTDHCGVIRVKTNEINPRYLTWALEQEGIEKRFSRAHRASTDRIKALTIKAPTIDEQNNFVEEVEKLEIKINEAKKIIDLAKSKKEDILKKYL
ncbi:N-6 DNA methylase [bacterium]|nr:N-6 DNA methylase [bacterium]MBU1433442.1 N-6 DNA methylase [bacterium]MBU1503376.1 N-6 DNA methylase [bacterium]